MMALKLREMVIIPSLAFDVPPELLAMCTRI